MPNKNKTMDLRANAQAKKQFKSTKLEQSIDKKDYEELKWFSDTKKANYIENHNDPSVFPEPLN